jgi:hypothetical protein
VLLFAVNAQPHKTLKELRRRRPKSVRTASSSARRDSMARCTSRLRCSLWRPEGSR